MNYIGISNGFHDAGITVLDNIGNILFAAHSERYSKQKHDKELSPLLLTDALSYLTTKEYELLYIRSMRCLHQVILDAHVIG